jgi:hypothetical protein
MADPPEDRIPARLPGSYGGHPEVRTAFLQLPPQVQAQQEDREGEKPQEIWILKIHLYRGI